MASWPAWSIIWYSLMCAVAVINMTLYLIILKRKKLDAEDLTGRRYQFWMRWLAAPLVFVCAYRSFFPNLYADRDVWYDSMACSIFIARMISTVAEVCWVAQIALAMAFLSRQVHRTWGSHATIASSVMVVSICCAEICSDFATITGNGLGFALEETSWGIAFTIILPAAIRLAFALWKSPSTGNTKGGRCTPLVYAMTMTVFGTLYLIWQWTLHVPPLYQAWRNQITDGVVFDSFGDGVWNSLTQRHPTRDFHTWGPSLVWLTGYFTLGVWSSIALTSAPRLQLQPLFECTSSNQGATSTAANAA